MGWLTHTRTEEIPARITARSIKILAPPVSNFTALGSAYLVNIENINSLVDERVIFDGGKELLLSRKKFQQLRREVKDYYNLSHNK